MIWAIPVITVILACFGWFLVIQLAKHREAYDLCISLVSLIEQIAKEGRELWQSDTEQLEQQDELRLNLRLAELEQRLDIIQKHYRGANKLRVITLEQISELRSYLTVAPMEYLPEVRAVNRINGIMRLTSDMTSSLLEYNYDYLNKGRRRSIQVGGTVLAIIIAFIVCLYGLDEFFAVVSRIFRTFSPRWFR